MESEFKIGYELTDYGKLLFEYDDSLGILDMSKQKKKAMLKQPMFYWLLLVGAVLIVWFVVSLVSNSIKHGFLQSVGLHMSGGFALLVMGTIIFLSIGGQWGKFARWSTRKKLKVKEFNKSENLREEYLDTQKNVLQIYEDYIVITQSGQCKAYNMRAVRKVKLCYADKYGRNFYLAFFADGGEFAISKAAIPSEKANIFAIKKIFGRLLEEEKINQKSKTSHSQLIAPIIFASLAIIAGGGVIAMHFIVDNSIPIFLGAFFIIGGLIGLCASLNSLPILKDAVLPILVGAVFLFFPYMLISTVYNSKGIALTVKHFFEVFNVFGAAVIFFGALGVVFVYSGIKAFINYIRFREKK